MKKLILIFVLNIAYCCVKPDCIKISKKYEWNGKYYFESLGNLGDNDLNSFIPTTLVTEEIFNKYKVGDKYCPEK